MLQGLPDWTAGDHLPHLRSLITWRGKVVSVRTKGDSIHMAAVFHRLPQGSTASGGPHPCSPVITCRRKVVSVRAKYNSVDLAAMFDRQPGRPAGGYLPLPGDMVLAGHR